MLLGAPIGKFALGQTADVLLAELVALEAPDVIAISGETAISAILNATETPDVIAISGEVFTPAVLDAVEEPDVIEIFAEAVITGVLEATEEADTAEFKVFDIPVGVLNATEESDTVEVRGRVWAVVIGACEPKTICLNGVRGKDPSFEGSKRDKDTDSCRTWDKAA